MSYLVTGATGNVGGRVADLLAQRGERPRVLARDAAKARARFGDTADVAVGDFGDAAALGRALAGVRAAFLVTSGAEIPAHDAAFAQAARAAGVPRIVKLSTLEAGRAGAGAIGQWHAAGEAAVAASGVAHVFVRPVGFMSNALNWTHAVKTEGVIRASTGDGRTAMIHPDDIAEVAIATLGSSAHDGAALGITGPAAINYAEMAAAIGDAIGKPVRFEPISDDAARERLARANMPPPLVDALVGLWRIVREGKAATVTDTVARVLGKPARTFAQWARENAESFT